MSDQTFAALSDSEVSWIEEQLRIGDKIVSAYSPADDGACLDLEALDRAWTAWIATQPTDVVEINRVINGIGISFGAILVRSGEFAWTIVTDEHGTDLGVRALPGAGDVLVFPANFVAKRWERKETGFLAGSFRFILAHVERVRKGE